MQDMKKYIPNQHQLLGIQGSNGDYFLSIHFRMVLLVNYDYNYVLLLFYMILKGFNKRYSSKNAE